MSTAAAYTCIFLFFSPLLILNMQMYVYEDVVRPEHAVEMFRLIPHARLSILPGMHCADIGEVTTGMEHSKILDLVVSIIEEFLNAPMPKKD